jgi:hypothetical protein
MLVEVSRQWECLFLDSGNELPRPEGGIGLFRLVSGIPIRSCSVSGWPSTGYGVLCAAIVRRVARRDVGWFETPGWTGHI